MYIYYTCTRSKKWIKFACNFSQLIHWKCVKKLVHAHVVSGFHALQGMGVWDPRFRVNPNLSVVQKLPAMH